MGIQYSHLSSGQRAVIEVLRHHGASLAGIARHIGCHRSTVMRECRRGWCASFSRYLCEFGRRYYVSARRSAGRNRRKLGEDLSCPAWRRVLVGLRADWSPEQIAGRLRTLDPLTGPLLASPTYVSHETIYRAIYDMPRSPVRTELVKLLRQSRSGRRKRSRGKHRFTGLQNITPISSRPPEVDGRDEAGHWEGDLIEGARGQSVVGTLVERSSRYVKLVKLDNASSHSILAGFAARLRTVAPCMRKTLTYDRGTEMALHEQLSAALGMNVYFCDAYCPWQRGTNENTNGLIRQYLPKGTDLSTLTHKQLSLIEHKLNTRPRRILEFQTPLEVFRALRTKALAQSAAQS
jgi:transposase, IS30 family